jgi:poly(glycerol-phosphate) alpha-glucosyltransferase
VFITPACNLPEGFATGAALSIEPSDAGVADGLRTLFAMSPDDLRAMGARGRALAERQFDWHTVAAQMASVYEWVLGAGPKPDCVVGYAA